MGSALQCPYPTCGRGDALIHDRTCDCEYRQPVVVCGRCGAANRVGARFCRACRGEASGEARGVSVEAGPASGLSIAGSFRRPPVVANGFLYALSKSGVLFQLSPRTGAKARQVARFELASAGYNRYALVDVAAGREAESEERGRLSGEQAAGAGGRLQGWTLLAVGPAGVSALSLASGTMRALYEARAPEEVVANRSEADATGFKGLVAGRDFVAFVVRSAAGENRLTIQYLAEDRPNEQPVMLEGNEVAGPALCGQRLVFCTERQMGLYDRETQAALVAELPAGFRPLLSPASGDVTIPPGGLPFVMEPETSEGGYAVYVAGVLRGRTGLLRVKFGEDQAGQGRGGLDGFRELPRGSSLATNRDGSVCLSVLDAVEVYGAAKLERTQVRAQPGMAAGFDAPYLCFFGEVDLAGRHRLELTKGAGTLELRFEDAGCNRETCCGVYVVGGDVVVAYLDVDAGESGEGLKFARWSLEG